MSNSENLTQGQKAPSERLNWLDRRLFPSYCGILLIICVLLFRHFCPLNPTDGFAPVSQEEAETFVHELEKMVELGDKSLLVEARTDITAVAAANAFAGIGSPSGYTSAPKKKREYFASAMRGQNVEGFENTQKATFVSFRQKKELAIVTVQFDKLNLLRHECADKKLDLYLVKRKADDKIVVAGYSSCNK